LAGLGLAALGSLTLTASAAKHEKAGSPPPALRIPTEPLGFYPQNSAYLISRTSSSSLDFIDSDHILFTFQSKGLLKRLPECQPDDEDQLIRAMVIHLPDGAVERSTEWRMHDRGRYLWPLRNGKFLVRQRDLLSVTDATLRLQPYIQAESPIRLVRLSPDARLLLVETDVEKHTEEEHRRLVQQASLEGLSPPREDVQLAIIRTDDRSVISHSRVLIPSDLPIVDQGSLEALPGRGNHWLVRYLPFRGDPSTIAEVASSCRPTEIPLNERTTFIVTCGESADHLVQTATLDGKTLWSYRWDSHYIWPSTATSEDGRRVAFSTLRVARGVNASEPFDETDVQAQRIEVLDIATGRLDLTQFASPILSAGQNYALSPDGQRFAVLRDNAIEVYDLPTVAPAQGSE
jgi:hypothetical protein